LKQIVKNITLSIAILLSFIMSVSTTHQTENSNNTTDQDHHPPVSKLILLVDDDEQVRNSTSLLLSEFGYQVILATNGEEALKVFHKNRNQIKVIITDYQMPIIDGKELCERLIAEQFSTKNIIMITAFLHDIQDYCQAKQIKALAKPVFLDGFLESIESCILQAEDNNKG